MAATADSITSLMNFLQDSEQGLVSLADHATAQKYKDYFREEA
jgi:hypothetical protein